MEMAGFSHACAAEIDPDAATTLRLNRPSWEVAEDDVMPLNASDYRGVALLAGGACLANL
ncbi:MAG: DNA cytosine methyltransferase [Bifidobacteriaceae bacterium]|nr:DNA cytosine methyltransferase [Bifidobacteriaceae bacterium]